MYSLDNWRNIGIIIHAVTYWPVGETVNSHAFHACTHGFEPRTGHQYFKDKRSNAFYNMSYL